MADQSINFEDQFGVRRISPLRRAGSADMARQLDGAVERLHVPDFPKTT